MQETVDAIAQDYLTQPEDVRKLAAAWFKKNPGGYYASNGILVEGRVWVTQKRNKKGNVATHMVELAKWRLSLVDDESEKEELFRRAYNPAVPALPARMVETIEQDPNFDGDQSPVYQEQKAHILRIWPNWPNDFIEKQSKQEVWPEEIDELLQERESLQRKRRI